MSINLILSLRDITLLKLQEGDEDEIYVIGGVKITRDGNPVVAKSKYFASSNVMTFTQSDKGQPRRLNPQGDVYDEVLEDDEVAYTRIYVVEHDAASTVQDITGKLREFLENTDLSELLENTPLEQGADLAKILLEFIDTLGNIFDEDDIIGEWQKTYRMKSIKREMSARNARVLSDKISFAANMDDALYEPVTAEAFFISQK
ncbi:MAG: hypothetical protein AB1757_14520 [Acidobacteriota bacterium]